MALNKTMVYRNLGTRVTFLYLEYEDLIVVLLIAPLAFFVGGFFNRNLFGIPLKLVLQWGIPALTILLLMTFKYGKPRGYLADWWRFQTMPHVYCGVERDSKLTDPYLIEGESNGEPVFCDLRKTARARSAQPRSVRAVACPGHSRQRHRHDARDVRR